MTRHYQDLVSASDWSCSVGNLIQPIRRTTQTWIVKRHQYGMSAVSSEQALKEGISNIVIKDQRWH